MTDASHTPPASGDGSWEPRDDAASWNASASPYGDANASTASGPLGDYGQTSAAPYGGAGEGASPADSQVTDLSNPYAQGSVGGASPYAQGSVGGASPYAQGSVGGASPYAQGSVGSASPYAQTSSTNPYQPDTSQAIAPAAAPSPYAQPAPSGAQPYGAPGQPGPGGVPPQGPVLPYSAQPYTPAGPSVGGTGLNVLGLISLIVGGLGVLMMIIGGAAIFFGVVGLVLGILGLVIAKFKSKKGLAIAGTIVSTVAIVGGVLSLIIVSTLFSSSGLSDYNSADYPVTVTISVTSTGSSGVDLDYNISNGKSDENAFDVSNALFSEPMPFEATVEMNINDTGSDYSRVRLTAQTDNYEDAVTCEIRVDDKVLAKDTSTGYASCSVSGIYAYLEGPGATA